MFSKDAPIKQKLLMVILLISGSVSFLTCIVFFVYETITFKQTTLSYLSTLGEIIASNSTAALAFRSEDDANEILRALQAERHVVSACLYDEGGDIFARYPISAPAAGFPENVKRNGFYYEGNFLEGFQQVKQGDMQLGTVFIRSDLEAFYQRILLYGSVALSVIAISFVLAFFLSQKLHKRISHPILSLTETAKSISEKNDYSVRARKFNNDEIGFLTNAFNKMLTEIEQRSREISALNLGLEQKVTERTQKLESLNKELNAFSYSISHDLRAPLRIINGYMSIFMEEYSDKMDDEAKKLANIILNNAKKMGRLIDDLLEFSHLGRKEISKSTFSMSELVNDVWQELMLLEEKRVVNLKLQKLPEAHADRATMRQVWFNLLSNAIKYSHFQETAKIEVGYEAPNYFIKDNGAGFDMKYYHKLFGVFQRLHSPKEFEGTGVGLAIVHRIIDKHGGRIWADSKPGSGSTFYFTLG